MPTDPRRDLPLAYLRTFLTLLVVLHHAVIAYCRFAPPPAPTLDAQPLLWTAFPIVDVHKWGLSDLIVGFNDSFFMALMFLIAGTFAWPSLVRKGAGRYMADRAKRLGVPFVASALVLAPLAYGASWLANASHAGGFWRQWMALGVWPAGPAWFLWVLLAFGALAALLRAIAPRAVEAFGAGVRSIGQRPLAAFALFVAVSLAAYLPTTAVVDPSDWFSWGPLFVQTSRGPLYLLYFATGVGLGAAGSAQGLLQPDGRLARRWPVWLAFALLAFLVEAGVAVAAMSAHFQGHPNHALENLASALFVTSSAATSFALLALFVRFATKPHRVLDSLSANAYGIYLLHYACVTWLQFALLHADLPGAVKAMAVFGGALAASWTLSAALRQIAAVARRRGAPATAARSPA